jgi:hypothetical protein
MKKQRGAVVLAFLVIGWIVASLLAGYQAGSLVTRHMADKNLVAEP